MPTPRSRFTASMRSLWPLVETFKREGWDVAALLAPSDVTEAAVADQELRIGQDVVAELWDRAALLSGDPSFGMRALRSLSSAKRGLVEYVLFNSPTLGSMIERGLRYERLWQEGRGASLETRGDQAVLRWTTAPGLRFSPPLSEFALGMMVLMARVAVGKSLPCEVRFPHPAPPDLRAYEAVFTGPVRFSAGEMSLSFATDLMSTPLPQADPALLALLEGHARDALSRLPPVHSLAQSLREALARSLNEAGASPEAIATKLRMSPRTLRRRLAAEGTSYQALVDEVRRELALGYLSDPQLSVTEIAFLLGFADTPTFSKAFRRWTGHSPREARAIATKHAHASASRVDKRSDRA